MQDQKVTKYRMTTTPSAPGAVVDKKAPAAKPVDKAKEYIKQIGGKIREAQNILVALSRDPSVDDMSAAIGLTLFLDMFSKHTTAIYSGQTPDALEFLKPEGTFEDNTDSLQDFIIALSKDKADHLRYRLDGDFVKVYITPYKTRITGDDLQFSYGDFNVDLVLALNVPTAGDLDEALAEHGRIMHDATTINMTTGRPGKFAEIEWCDPRASSVSEMATRLIMNLNGESKNLDSDVATALLTGIVAATGRFSNERTTSMTLELASKLMMSGADQQLISANVVDNIVGTSMALPEEEPKPKPKKQPKLTNERNEPVLPKVVEPEPEAVPVNVVPKPEAPKVQPPVQVEAPVVQQSPTQVEAPMPERKMLVEDEPPVTQEEMVTNDVQSVVEEPVLPGVEKSAQIQEIEQVQQDPNMYSAPAAVALGSKDYGAMLEQALAEPAQNQVNYSSYYDNIPQYAQGAQAGAYDAYYGNGTGYGNTGDAYDGDYGQQAGYENTSGGATNNYGAYNGYDNNTYNYGNTGYASGASDTTAAVASTDANAALSAFLANNGALGASEAIMGGQSNNVATASGAVAGGAAATTVNPVATTANPAASQAPAVAEAMDDVGQFKIPNAYPVAEAESELPPTMPREIASQLKGDNVAQPVENNSNNAINLPPAPAPSVSANLMPPGVSAGMPAGFNPAAAAAPQVNENPNDAGGFRIPGM